MKKLAKAQDGTAPGALVAGWKNSVSRSAAGVRRGKEKLLAWLKERGMTDFIEVTENPLWGELKKRVQVAGSYVVTADGEIVEGVEVVQRPPVFKVATD
ncbi:MAG: host-nuclease inhibitor Gam family protein [Syntrophothermus sp.]|uniref:host-nuclease inhibitor Gam family protein n=1 Tax=Syntrophothermus sp. TaxID=2736299 RepID=UPI00257D012A|nr:host-nuclease inhibitor Gam family protein [Syntrophothermus sp.]NSW84344.1 host-nuclease inhibitor Gam family protein [Syntrophothermus sp.]